MITLPQAATDIQEIADFIADPVEGARFPATKLRYRNDRAAASIGLDSISDGEWIGHFGRFVPIKGSLMHPLALRYHGHQFRNYNPDIGDGRGFLFAQMRSDDGRLMDLGTKGSGQTPYSRFGDGRLTLKGAVREILATEMLEALGVNTSKTLSVIETGEALDRNDEPSPTRGAILFRLSHGHIRIGSFQRLAVLHDDHALRRLTDYALAKYYGEPGGTDAPARLLTHVAEQTAALAASYMAAGFVHGVLNSDNINVSGESFDYGPWRFTPKFEAEFTAAYFDAQGLYAFGRQAEAIHWDVVQLAIAFSRIAEQDALIDAVNAFGPAYQAAILDRTLWRLGVKSRTRDEDVILVQAIERTLIESGCTIDQFYFDWMGGVPHEGASGAPPYASDIFAAFRATISNYEPARARIHPYWQREQPCSLHIDEVEAIWAPIAENDDWTRLHAKVAEIREMGSAMLQLYLS
ncbi:MAG: protein adenylyltransferase SelO family protein [Sphingomonadaceae bacterium]